MKDKIAKLLNKKVDRKDFLKYAATTGLMAVGGGVILKSVDGFEKLSQKPKATVDSKSKLGYGSNVYGG